jgi:hypothetical protein
MKFSRVTFASGQYVSCSADNVFDAVANAISGAACVLRSRKVLNVEVVSHIDELLSFPALRELVKQAQPQLG